MLLQEAGGGGWQIWRVVHQSGERRETALKRNSNFPLANVIYIHEGEIHQQFKPLSKLHLFCLFVFSFSFVNICELRSWLNHSENISRIFQIPRCIQPMWTTLIYIHSYSSHTSDIQPTWKTWIHFPSLIFSFFHSFLLNFRPLSKLCRYIILLSEENVFCSRNGAECRL